jgi:hypothetical protein
VTGRARLLWGGVDDACHFWDGRPHSVAPLLPFLIAAFPLHGRGGATAFAGRVQLASDRQSVLGCDPFSPDMWLQTVFLCKHSSFPQRHPPFKPPFVRVLTAARYFFSSTKSASVNPVLSRTSRCLLLRRGLSAPIHSLEMRRRSQFLVLTLAAAAALASSANYDTDDSSLKPKYDVGTKDAPVDGKDGKPHQGPFVEIEGLRKTDSESQRDLPPLKDRPEDPTMIDGKKIPESNDGVMDDKNRPEPEEGTTGTGGGVTEKDKARKAKEGKTGSKAENKPETPKEAPPLPHSEQEKILSEKDKKDKSKTGEDGSSAEVCTCRIACRLRNMLIQNQTDLFKLAR